MRRSWPWKSAPGSWHSKCKGPETGVTLVVSTEWKEVRVAGVLEFKDVLQTPQDLVGAVRVLFKEHSAVFKQGNDSPAVMWRVD